MAHPSTMHAAASESTASLPRVCPYYRTPNQEPSPAINYGLLRPHNYPPHPSSFTFSPTSDGSQGFHHSYTPSNMWHQHRGFGGSRPYRLRSTLQHMNDGRSHQSQPEEPRNPASSSVPALVSNSTSRPNAPSLNGTSTTLDASRDHTGRAMSSNENVPLPLQVTPLYVQGFHVETAPHSFPHANSGDTTTSPRRSVSSSSVSNSPPSASSNPAAPTVSPSNTYSPNTGISPLLEMDPLNFHPIHSATSTGNTEPVHHSQAYQTPHGAYLFGYADETHFQHPNSQFSTYSQSQGASSNEPSGHSQYPSGPGRTENFDALASNNRSWRSSSGPDQPPEAVRQEYAAFLARSNHAQTMDPTQGDLMQLDETGTYHFSPNPQAGMSGQAPQLSPHQSYLFSGNFSEDLATSYENGSLNQPGRPLQDFQHYQQNWTPVALADPERERRRTSRSGDNHLQPQWTRRRRHAASLTLDDATGSPVGPDYDAALAHQRRNAYFQAGAIVGAQGRTQAGLIMHGRMDYGPTERRATAKVIESLIRVELKTLDEEDRICHICFEPYNEKNPEGLTESPVKLPCGHVFGKSCIVRWFHDKCTCPACRQKVESEAVPRVQCTRASHMTGPQRTTPESSTLTQRAMLESSASGLTAHQRVMLEAQLRRSAAESRNSARHSGSSSNTTANANPNSHAHSRRYARTTLRRDEAPASSSLALSSPELPDDVASSLVDEMLNSNDENTFEFLYNLITSSNLPVVAQTDYSSAAAPVTPRRGRGGEAPRGSSHSTPVAQPGGSGNFASHNAASGSGQSPSRPTPSGNAFAQAAERLARMQQHPAFRNPPYGSSMDVPMGDYDPSTEYGRLPVEFVTPNLTYQTPFSTPTAPESNVRSVTPALTADQLATHRARREPSSGQIWQGLRDGPVRPSRNAFADQAARQGNGAGPSNLSDRH